MRHINQHDIFSAAEGNINVVYQTQRLLKNGLRTLFRQLSFKSYNIKGDRAGHRNSLYSRI